MLLIYLLVVLTVLYYSLYYYFTRTFNYWKNRNVKGPKPVAIFGNIKDSALRRKNVGEVFQELYNMFPQEKVVGIYRMTTPCLLVRDLEIVKHIMIKDFNLFRDRGIEFSSTGLGLNLFHAGGDTWTALRTRLSPIFSPAKLKNMFYLLNGRTDIFMDYLENKSEINPEYDIGSLVQKYTISTIFACAFGVDFDNFHAELDESLQTIDKMVVTPSFLYEVDMMYPGLLKKIALSPFPLKVRNFFDRLVADVTSTRNGKSTSRGDFMDLMLQLREVGEITNSKIKEGSDSQPVEITDDIIAAQAFIFYMAGNETSSTTMAYMLYELARNPEIQAKLREEVDTVMKSHGAINGEITYEALQDMKYLEKIFFETLRMYPVLDPLLRKAQADYKIPNTDLEIKEGLTVSVPVLGIHYDEKYYPNPNVFDPERFDSELVGARHPCAYLPFGVGPRYCIGMRFGILQSQLGIAKIISRFRVETCKNTHPALSIEPNRVILGPKERIFLNIVPRKF